MKIFGFQKMTLLDYPGKVAATIFAGGCNFRCPFCHNASLVTDLSGSEQLDTEDILGYLERRRGLLDGVCVTGGEPLLYDSTRELIKTIKEMGYAVKLDTNGSFPEKLRELVSDGLIDYVAMDVKNTKEKYRETVGLRSFDVAPIEESIGFLLSGAVDFEFRTTVVKEFHTPDDIENIAKWISGAPRYFLQGFIDSGNLIGDGLHAHDDETMKEMCQRASLYVKNTNLRGI